MSAKNRAIVFLSTETFLKLLQREVFIESLPDDVELLGLHPDIRRQGLIILLGSESFPPTAEGAQIAEISPTLITRAAFAERMAHDLTVLTNVPADRSPFEPGPISALAEAIAESIGGVA